MQPIATRLLSLIGLLFLGATTEVRAQVGTPPGWTLEERTWAEVFGDCVFPSCMQGTLVHGIGSGHALVIKIPPQREGKRFSASLGGLRGPQGAATVRLTLSPWRGDLRGYAIAGTDPYTSEGCRRSPSVVHYKIVKTPKRYAFDCELPADVPLYLHMVGTWPSGGGSLDPKAQVCAPPLPRCGFWLYHQGH